MPTKPRSACSVPTCPNLSIKNGRCAIHQRKPWEGRTWASSPWSTPEGRRLRSQVLKEEPCCRYCGVPSTAVDHIKPRAWGGSDARENLQSLCNTCQREKAKREAAEGRRRNR